MIHLPLAFKFSETNNMPTTITSAGVTFNDTTTLTSANGVPSALKLTTARTINGVSFDGTANITVPASGTSAAKAWVNFNGVQITSGNANSFNTISCNSGATTGTWTANGWAASDVGTIYKITQINGVVGATFGGVNVSTLGVQIISVVAGVSATFTFLSGTTTSAQSVTGTGSSASGFSWIGTGIRSSFNVSSVTKNGTGDYTVNFATAMADANYSAVVTSSTFMASIFSSSGNTTASSRMQTNNLSGTLTDAPYCCVAIFGN
jgi:hypothetical protein